MLGPWLRYGIPLAAAVAVAALVGLAFSQTGSGWWGIAIFVVAALVS
jgi:hypothetical protein